LDFQQAVSFFRSRRMLKNHPGAVCAFYARRRVARNRVGRVSGQKMLIADWKTRSRALVCIMLQKQRKALPCKPLTERTSQQIEVEASKSLTWSFARRSHRRNRPRGLNYEIQQSAEKNTTALIDVCSDGADQCGTTQRGAEGAPRSFRAPGRPNTGKRKQARPHICRSAGRRPTKIGV